MRTAFSLSRPAWQAHTHTRKPVHPEVAKRRANLESLFLLFLFDQAIRTERERERVCVFLILISRRPRTATGKRPNDWEIEVDWLKSYTESLRGSLSLFWFLPKPFACNGRLFKIFKVEKLSWHARQVTKDVQAFRGFIKSYKIKQKRTLQIEKREREREREFPSLEKPEFYI